MTSIISYKICPNCERQCKQASSILPRTGNLFRSHKQHYLFSKHTVNIGKDIKLLYCSGDFTTIKSGFIQWKKQYSNSDFHTSQLPMEKWYIAVPETSFLTVVCSFYGKPSISQNTRNWLYQRKTTMSWAWRGLFYIAKLSILGIQRQIFRSAFCPTKVP